VFEFTIFRIPVRVEPWFWLTSFLLGGGLWLKDRDDFIGTLLWMIVVFVSILIHELGHAMTSRKLTGKEPAIRLWAMGGLAYPNTHLSRKDSLRVSLAGPAAGLGFFAVVTLACIIKWGPVDGFDIISWLTLGKLGPILGNGEGLRSMDGVTYSLVNSLVFVNFWWSIVNLLPVFPLDGGQAYAAIESSQKKVFQVGLGTGVAAAIFGITIYGSIYVCLLFGYLAYQNWQRLQQLNGRY